jgi:hypothetical protein
MCLSGPVTKSFLEPSLRDSHDLRTYSGFCTGVKMLRLPNSYYVNVSIHSSNTHALLEAGRVEDLLGNFESNTMEILRECQVKLGAAEI